MTTFTSHYPTMADYIGWLREQADARDGMARTARTKREAERWFGEAAVYDRVADDLDGEHGVKITEIHKDEAVAIS
jgi:hypothetical protein